MGGIRDRKGRGSIEMTHRAKKTSERKTIFSLEIEPEEHGGLEEKKTA